LPAVESVPRSGRSGSMQKEPPLFMHEKNVGGWNKVGEVDVPK
jgi:hypothetical protein